MADDYDVEVAELQAIASGDRDAFCRWFARCEIPLKRSVQGFAGVVDVEAVVQDTAMKLWQAPSRITPDGRSGFLLRWARTVALNATRNAARRARHPAAGHQAEIPPEGELADQDRVMPPDPFLRDRVRRCLERLPIHQQRAFRARLGDRGTRADREIAASIDMRFDAFRQNLSRGRSALVTCLGSFKIDLMEYLR